MEHAREHARQDLERRTQEYFTSSMQGKRRKQRQVYNEAYERIDMAGQDLTQPEKNERRKRYVERVRDQVKSVLQADPAKIVVDYFDNPSVQNMPAAVSMP